MNPEVKTLWLTALRSGEYKQGKGYLEKINSEGVREYCCLGVLCDLAVKAGIVEKETDGAAVSVVGYRVGSYIEAAGLIPKISEWAGVSEIGILPEEQGRGSLINLNDGADFTFSQIADVIEEWL